MEEFAEAIVGLVRDGVLALVILWLGIWGTTIVRAVVNDHEVIQGVHKMVGNSGCANKYNG